MSLRHALLGLVDLQPCTGYELTQFFDSSLSNAWHASHSQIYPELGRLEAAGMVEVVGEGARGSRTWAVTADGREELRRWMLESEPNRAQRNETALRWFLVFLLDPADRRAVLERELAFVDRHIDFLRELAGRLDELPEPQPFAPTVDLGLRVDAVMRDWLAEHLDETG